MLDTDGNYQMNVNPSLFLPHVVLFALGLLLLSSGCDSAVDDSNADPGDQQVTLVATSYPLQQMLMELAKDVQNLNVATLPLDSVDWRPSSSDIQTLQKANAILINGADYEPWLATATVSRSRIVDTSAHFKNELIKRGSSTHQHGPDGPETSQELSPYVWLDPQLAKQQARAVAQQITMRLPDQDAVVQQNLQRVLEKLSFDLQIQSLRQHLQGSIVLTEPIVFDYLLAAVNAKSIEAPLAKSTKEVIDELTARSDLPPKALLLVSQPVTSEPLADILDQIGVTTLHLESLITPSDNVTFFEAYETGLKRLETAAAKIKNQ